MFANKQIMTSSSPILSLQKVHILSFLAIFCHLPVSMENFIFEHLKFDKLILYLADKLDKYFSNPNSNLRIE
jgi:hypothetical protein